MSTREHWLAERRKGIGGSDIAAIIGLSDWTTPLDVYLDKIGEAPEREPNGGMTWGTLLEPVIRQWFVDRTGLSVGMQPQWTTVVHPQHTWFRATPDGYVLGEVDEPPALLEIKTARTSEGWGPDGSDEIPEYYVAQVQHTLEVTDLNEAYVVVLIGGSDARTYHIKRDHEAGEALIEAAGAFWHQHVLRRIPPPARNDAEGAARLRRIAAKGTVEATDDIAHALAQLRRARQGVDEWTAIAESWESRIQVFMGERETLTIAGEPVATWKTQRGRESVDVKRMREEHAALVARYTKTGEPTRRFALKKLITTATEETA